MTSMTQELEEEAQIAAAGDPSSRYDSLSREETMAQDSMLQQELQWAAQHRVWRAGGGPVEIDYSIFSVAVFTLGLIMMVEVFRHRIDHAASGRPFFKAVLDGVYQECR